MVDRADAYMESCEFAIDDKSPSTIHELAHVGQDLRSQLAALKSMLAVSTEVDEIHVAWMYYHAISIYLSGIFDYILCSVRTGPGLSLQDDEVAIHREGILRFSSKALQQSQVSRVFLLLPLRIAGNRCSTTEQCREVFNRICALENEFAVAKAFKAELMQIWSSRSLWI